MEKATFEHVVALRRELHQYPEIGFDLPRTLALVRRELDALDIPYTEEFGRSSIVATINPQCKGFTIGIRGDMDALPMQEEDLTKPYSSKIPGQMHACGHDVHTAMLLGVARELKAREKELTCRVKLLFTPAEEYINPGCKEMVEAGVMKDIDCAVTCHVAPTVDTGEIRMINGGQGANSMGFTVEFFGKSSHAASQQNGVDAISMAVEAHSLMHAMVAKEFAPNVPRLFNIGSIEGGHTNNIICDYCKMFGSARAHSDEVSEKLTRRIFEICEGVAKIHGGEAKVTINKFLPYVFNNETMHHKLWAAAEKVVGAGKVSYPAARSLGGEDFGFISREKPCAFFSLGTRKDEATGHALHTVNFDVDEAAMEHGVNIFVQFVLDNMGGIAF